MANTATGSLAARDFAAYSWARKGCVALMGTVFLAACSHVALPLPWTPVPLNLQPFGVLVLALLFGPAMASVTAAAFLLEGAAGLPVFSPAGLGGMAQLLGPTGGYLMSYPVAAWAAGRLGAGKNFFGGLGAAMAGDAIVLICGAAWLIAITHISLRAGSAAGVLPFLPGDFLKCAAAAAIATGFSIWRSRTR